MPHRVLWYFEESLRCDIGKTLWQREIGMSLWGRDNGMSFWVCDVYTFLCVRDIGMTRWICDFYMSHCVREIGMTPSLLCLHVSLDLKYWDDSINLWFICLIGFVILGWLVEFVMFTCLVAFVILGGLFECVMFGWLVDFVMCALGKVSLNTHASSSLSLSHTLVSQHTQFVMCVWLITLVKLGWLV